MTPLAKRKLIPGKMGKEVSVSSYHKVGINKAATVAHGIKSVFIAKVGDGF